MTDESATKIHTYDEYVERYLTPAGSDSTPQFIDGLDFYAMGQRLASAVLTRHVPVSAHTA